jgi:hypothetical protein
MSNPLRRLEQWIENLGARQYRVDDDDFVNEVRAAAVDAARKARELPNPPPLGTAFIWDAMRGEDPRAGARP